MSDKKKSDNMDALIDKMTSAVNVDKRNAEKLPTTNIDIVNKVTDVLFDMKVKAKKKMLGILNKNQISGIKKLDMVNQVMFDGKNPLIQNIIDNEIYFSVAEKGKGREQLVALTKVEDQESIERTGFRKYL
jgi:TATA-binding protein-associated factor Taf7